MKTFEEIYHAKVVENYSGICDRCAAPIKVDGKFIAIQIGSDEDWDYLIPTSFIIYCFVCKSKDYIMKINNHPFDISGELTSLKVEHEHR